MRYPKNPKGPHHPMDSAYGHDPRWRTRSPAQSRRRQATFDEFDALELYCPKCGRSVPVRKRILLALPEGDKYEYLCENCSESLGTKLDKGPPGETRLII